MSKSEMILELQDEVKALKAKLGGYQTSNENYRKANKVLSNKIKELDDCIDEHVTTIYNLTKKLNAYKALHWYKKIFAK